LSQAITHVARLRNVWLFGLAILGIGGCVQGTLGYLPLYLRGMGWADARADGALSAFHIASLIFTIPIAFTSDKFGSRRKVLAAAGVMIAMGVGLLSLADGWMVWIAIFIAGMVRDGFMGVFMTSIMETEGVGFMYAGTAIGVVMIFSGVGNLLAPPLGNSLAGIGPGVPFALWAVLAVIGIIGILATQERRPGKVLVEIHVP
jgi:MFS family permease